MLSTARKRASICKTDSDTDSDKAPPHGDAMTHEELELCHGRAGI